MNTRSSVLSLCALAVLLLAVGCQSTLPYTPYPGGRFQPARAYHHPNIAAPAARAEEVQPAEVAAEGSEADWSQPVPAAAARDEAAEIPSLNRDEPASEAAPAEVVPAEPPPAVEQPAEAAAEEVPESVAKSDWPLPAPAAQADEEAEQIPARYAEEEPAAPVRSKIEEMSDRYAQGYPGGAAASAATVDDRQLARDVLNRLLDDSITGSLMFGVNAQNGMVTVDGAVPDETIRTRALGIVRSTPGVRGVIDRLSRYR